MNKITVLLLILPLLTTEREHFKGKKQQCSLDAQDGQDKTKDQIKTMFDIFQSFDKQKIEKAYAEWISQNPTFKNPSKIFSSTKINFTKFIPVEDTIPISNLSEVKCEFQRSLRIIFGLEQKFNVEGNMEFLAAENDSLCRVPFTFAVVRDDIELKIKISNETMNLWHSNIIENFKFLKGESEFCQQIAYGRQLKINQFYEAIAEIIKERFYMIAKSVFRSLFDKCLHIQFDENKENYLHFKLHSNMQLFPWKSDHHELKIKGLNNFAMLQVAYQNETANFTLSTYSCDIQWDVMSVETMNTRNFLVYRVQIVVSIDMPIDYTKINLENFDELNDESYIENDGFRVRKRIHWLGGRDMSKDKIHITLKTISEHQKHRNIKLDDTKIQNTLEILIMMGIDQTFQEIRCDGTERFRNSIQKIIRPINGKTFENVYIDLDQTPHKINSTNLEFFFSEINMEAYPRLENNTCIAARYDNVKVGTITYKNINGTLELLHTIIFSNGSTTEASLAADVYIKQANINIPQQKYTNWINEHPIQINDDFKQSDKTITFRNRFSHSDRIAIAQQIMENFIQVIRSRIRKTVNSALRLLFDTCKNSLKNIVESNLNGLNDSQRYFAFIRGYGVNSKSQSLTQSAVIVVNGTWNFKDMNANYENGNLVVDGLQIENVTGIMKLWKGPTESVTVNYTAKNLSFRIDTELADVRVKIPECFGCFVIANVSNTSSFILDITEIREIFESTVAPFIEQSIYGDSINHGTKRRNSITDIISETALKDESSTYDGTLEFVNNFVKILKDIPPTKINFRRNKILRFKVDEDDTPSNRSNFPSSITFKFDNALTEEICDIFNYSRFIQRGNISLFDESNRYGHKLSSFPFKTSIRCKVNISDDGIYSKHLEIDIDREAINIIGGFESKDENILKKHFANMATMFVQKNFKDYTRRPNICKHRLSSLAPESLEKHFYLITNTLTYTSKYMLKYHIKLYGLHNLKSLLVSLFTEQITFEITATNLTAHIIWGYYIGNSFTKIPNEMNVEIDKISLRGEMAEHKHLLFHDLSQQLQLSSKHNSITEKFRTTLELIIIDSIEQLITKHYKKDQPGC